MGTGLWSREKKGPTELVRSCRGRQRTLCKGRERGLEGETGRSLGMGGFICVPAPSRKGHRLSDTRNVRDVISQGNIPRGGNVIANVSCTSCNENDPFQECGVCLEEASWGGMIKPEGRQRSKQDGEGKRIDRSRRHPVDECTYSNRSGERSQTWDKKSSTTRRP